MEKNKRLSPIVLLRFSLLGLVLWGVVCGFWLQSFLESRRLEELLETEYRRTLSELAASAASLEESLVLLQYAASPQQTALCAAQAARQSGDTAYLMGRLPFSAASSEKVTAAFSHIERWAEAVARQSIRSDVTLHQDDGRVLPGLTQAVRLCSEVLTEWEQTVLGGEVRSFFDASASEEGDAAGMAAQGLQRMAAELEKLPIPGNEDAYADQPQEPAVLRGLPEISEGEALRAALDFTGLEEGQLRFLHRTEGRIPCYGIGGHLDGGEISLEITVRGGMVLSMMSSRQAEAKTLSLEEAQKNVEDFLRRRGYDGMVFCGVADREDALLLQYVYAQDGVLCYPDRLQIGVAADTGKIVSFESSDYLMHHLPRRELPSAVLSETEALAALSPDLEPEDLTRCIIRVFGQGEVLCYEAAGRTEDGRRLVFYINARTGAAESQQDA